MKMACNQCSGPFTVMRENHRYAECGVSNVVLVDLEIRRCGSCGDTELVIPKIAQLHRLIAKTFAEKPMRLTPEEIRFIRKYVGWSGAMFASNFGVTPETVSRWENGQKRMSHPAERLLRVCALAPESFRDISILQGLAVEAPRKNILRLVLKNHWETLAA